MPRKPFTPKEAKRTGDALGIHWTEELTPERLAKGMNVELEHGTRGGDLTNVTNDHPGMTARIALAHLKELPDYYERLERMEREVRASEGKRPRARERRGVDYPGNVVSYAIPFMTEPMLSQRKRTDEQLKEAESFVRRVEHAWSFPYELNYDAQEITPALSSVNLRLSGGTSWARLEQLRSWVCLPYFIKTQQMLERGFEDRAEKNLRQRRMYEELVAAWNAQAYSYRPSELFLSLQASAINATFSKIEEMAEEEKKWRYSWSRFLSFSSRSLQTLQRVVDFEDDVPLVIQEMELRTLVTGDNKFHAEALPLIRQIAPEGAFDMYWFLATNAYRALTMSIWRRNPGMFYMAAKRLLMGDAAFLEDYNAPRYLDDAPPPELPELLEIEQIFYEAMFEKVPEGLRAP